MKNLSLRTKLISICSLIASFVLVAGGISYYALKNVSAKYTTVTDKSLPSVTLIQNMFLEFREVRIQLRTLGIEGLSAKDQEEAVRGAKKAIEAYEALVEEYKKLDLLPGEEEKFKAIVKDWEVFKGVGGRVFDIVASHDPNSYAKLRYIFLNDCPQAAGKFKDSMVAMVEFQREEANRWVVKAQSATQASNRTLLAVVLAAFLFSFALGFVFSSALAKSLNQLTERLSRGANLVASASQQIANSGTNLSSSATEQAAALQETVASVDQVSAMVNMNAENANKSRIASEASRDGAVRGKKAVEDVMSSIEDINHSNTEIMKEIESSNQQISQIVDMINEIGDKTKVINDIVFQTKLLSFNASVEAARAGEHGKGFAVVAEEVGNLAKMSGNAAKEITDLLDTSTRRVKEIVSSTQKKVEQLVGVGKEKVQNGTLTAERCGQVLDEIVTNVTHVAQMVSEIANASREQSQGVREINNAMRQMDQTTQQNAAGANESASAAESLTKQADELRNIVNQLSETVKGRTNDEELSAVISAPLAFHPKKQRKLSAAPIKKAVGDLPSALHENFEDV